MFVFFFFNDTATTEIYTLSLHDALPIFPKTKQLPSSIVRRNLQREHLKELTNLVLGLRAARLAPPDALSLARAHLPETDRKIHKALGQESNTIAATTLTHLEDSHERLAN